MPSSPRPLSPHLQIYRWQWTMSYSILHRFTGMGLTAGLVLFSLWLIALAFNPPLFSFIQTILEFPPMIMLLWLWLWCFFYHLVNGIRHLIWDIGFGFELSTAQFSGHLGFGVSLCLTALFIFFG